MSNKALAPAALMLTAIFVIASCSGSGSSGSSSPAASNPLATSAPSSASPTVSESKTFTSTMYGYTLTLPEQWSTVPALSKWDGRSGWTYASSFVDLFVADNGTSSWGVAAPWTRDLGAYTTFLIAENYRYHGDTCPREPNTRSRVTIGGLPGVLLGYNCGILINVAATVHHGVGYWFVFRDPGVYAATDPTDHARFLTMLRSVQFPD
jgi:hypothetical protein